MATHTRHTKNFEIYFCTLTCYKWLPLFEEANFYDAVYNWFDHLKVKGCYILAYVIMPNHIHTLFYPTRGSLNKLTANGKRFMAYEMVKRLKLLGKGNLLEELQRGVTAHEKEKGKKHHVFRSSFDARLCFNEQMTEQKLDYIHHNPVQDKWHLVRDYTNYLHSSASFYEKGEQGPYDVVHYKEIIVPEAWEGS